MNANDVKRLQANIKAAHEAVRHARDDAAALLDEERMVREADRGVEAYYLTTIYENLASAELKVGFSDRDVLELDAK